ncbi:MAG: hypothetical protein HYT87_12880 [Nitrospirae bacterium]|nr:hypothetical protein [Nitrospirota bacterium]
MAEKVLTKGELAAVIPFEEMDSAFTVFKTMDEKGLFGVPVIFDQDEQRLSIYRATAEAPDAGSRGTGLASPAKPVGSYLAKISTRDIVEKVRRRMEEGGHFVFDVPIGELGRCMDGFAFLMPKEGRYFRFGIRPMDMEFHVVGVQGQEIQPSDRSWWQDVSSDPFGKLDHLRRPKAA